MKKRCSECIYLYISYFFIITICFYAYFLAFSSSVIQLLDIICTCYISSITYSVLFLSTFRQSFYNIDTWLYYTSLLYVRSSFWLICLLFVYLLLDTNLYGCRVALFVFCFLYTYDYIYLHVLSHLHL